MKSLNRIIFVCFMAINSFVFSQGEKEIKIEELGITVDTIENLKTINWDELFSIFEYEKNNSKISLFIQLKEINVLDKNSQEMNIDKLKYVVTGYVYEKDKLKQQLVGITNKLIAKYKDK